MPNASIVDGLTLAGATGNWTSTLDITDNTLIVGGVNDLQAFKRVVDQVKNARDRGPGGRWSGAGITSSSAAANPLTGIAAQYMFGSGNIVLRYTYNGDANGDGFIDADDYFRIDSGFLNQLPDPMYENGDFNYDGLIDADDYFLIDSAFLGQGAPLSSATIPIAAVPEPTLGAALLLVLPLGFGRTLRRRRRHAADRCEPLEVTP
jgi:hypothetical protein